MSVVEVKWSGLDILRLVMEYTCTDSRLNDLRYKGRTNDEVSEDLFCYGGLEELTRLSDCNGLRGYNVIALIGGNTGILVGFLIYEYADSTRVNAFIEEDYGDDSICIPYTDDVIIIHNIAVSPDWRNKGLATKLLSSIDMEGCSVILNTTSDSNSFWSGLGFEEYLDSSWMVNKCFQDKVGV